MESDLIQAEIANHLVKECKVLKQSRYLKVWSERYLVLTQNYIFTFKTKQYIEPADIINLSYFVSIKSSVPSEEDPTINDFTIETTVCSINFRCHNSPDKWNWIVAIERLMDLRAKGNSYYNSVTSLTKRGFDSVSDFHKSYPDGPEGKYIGIELKKLYQTVYEMGENDIKAEKQNQENEKKLISALSEERKKTDLFEALGIQTNHYVQKDKTEISEKTNQEHNEKNEEQGSLKKSSNLSSMFEGRSHGIVQDLKEIEKKSEDSNQEIKQISVNPSQQTSQTQAKQQNSQTDIEGTKRKKSNMQELEVIPKGKVNQITQLYEHKIEEQAKDQEEVKRRDSTSYYNTPSPQTGNVKKSRVIVGVFDEFEDSTCPKKLIILLEFIVNLMCEESCSYRNYIKFESLNHTKRNNFTEIFIEYYLNKNDEQSILKMLKFFSLIFTDCPSLFSETQLLLLKNAFFKYLKMENNQIVRLAVGNIEKIKCKVHLSQEQLTLVEEKNSTNMESTKQNKEDWPKEQVKEIDPIII